MLLRHEDFLLSVFSVAEKKLNTEVTETLGGLCGEALGHRGHGEVHS